MFFVVVGNFNLKFVVVVVVFVLNCPKLECAVSPQLILKHLISSLVSLAQLVSLSVALPAELAILLCRIILIILMNQAF